MQWAPSGIYTAPYATNAAVAFTAASGARAFPIMIPNACTINRMSLWCTTAVAGATAGFELAVYTDEDDAPADKLVTYTYDNTGTGIKHGAIAPDWQVPAAMRVWVVYRSLTGTPGYNGMSVYSRQYHAAYPTASGNVALVRTYAGLAVASLPGPMPTDMRGATFTATSTEIPLTVWFTTSAAA